MRLLIALIVWIGAVAGAAEISSVVANSIHNKPASAGGGSNSGPSGASFDASSVKATDPQSLFRTANFSRALATARTRLGAGVQLNNLVVYPGYLDLTAIVRGSEEVNFYIAANGSYTETDTGANPGSPLFGLATIKAEAPATLAQRIASSGRVPESQLNYMVVEVESPSRTLNWLVYPLQGNSVEYFEAMGASGPLYEYRTNSSTGLQPVSR